MTRIATLPLTLMLLTTALAGCLGRTDTANLEETTSQNSADLTLIEVLNARIDALANESGDNTTAELQEEIDAIIESRLAAGEATVTTLETAVANINAMLAEHATQIAALEAALANATSCQLVPFGNCAGADLSGADLSGMERTGIDLRSANLEGTNLSEAELNESLLMNIKAEGADFSGAWQQYIDLTGAYLVSADLTDTGLRYADLTGADLTNADLMFTDFTDATDTNFENIYWHLAIWTDGNRSDGPPSSL